MRRLGYAALLIATLLWLMLLTFVAAVYAQNRVLHTSLVLLIDVSASVSHEEWRIQRNAYAYVLGQRAVQHALEGAQVTVILYSDVSRVVCPWGTAAATAECMLEVDRHDSVMANGTCPGEAFRRADQVLHNSEPPRVVVDLSGDGRENCDHAPLSMWRQTLLERYDAEINGLAITNADPFLDQYYRDEVIANPGFVVAIAAYQDFVRALRAKILLEVARAD